MEELKYIIELFLKEDSNLEIGAAEFSRALELPKKMFKDKLKLMTLNYKSDEKNIAIQHCFQLNQEINKNGFNNVEFRIKEVKISKICSST